MKLLDPGKLGLVLFQNPKKAAPAAFSRVHRIQTALVGVLNEAAVA